LTLWNELKANSMLDFEESGGHFIHL